MSDYKRLTNKEYDYEYDFCLGCEYRVEPNGCNRYNGECANYDRFCEMYERLCEIEDKIEQGLLFELPYEPKRLILGKGDDELLCPECLSDVMGGFAIESNNPLLQCPHCGCFIDNYNKPPIDWEEAEARLKELQK